MTSMMLVAGMMWGIAAPGTKEEPKKKDSNPPLIVGSWKVEKLTIAGMELPAPALTFEFTDDGKFLKHDGRRPDDRGSTYKVDTAKSPSELDWLLEGKKEQTIKGIYRIDGDTLMICFEDGFKGERPEKFESPGGTKRMLWTLSRTTKKK